MIPAHKSVLNTTQPQYTEEELQETIDKDLRLYIVVNKDLKTIDGEPISRGKEDAQVGHGAEIFLEKVFDRFMDETIPETERLNVLGELEVYLRLRKKIILEAPQKVCEKLEKEGYLAIRDKGFTELAPNSLTVVTLGIFSKDDLPKKLKNLRLRH